MPKALTITGLVLSSVLAAGCASTMPQTLVDEFADAHPAAAPEEAPRVRRVAPAVLSRGATDQPLVALTFDACSTWVEADYDAQVIAVLREHEAPATLFLGGLWMLRFDALTRELHDDPLFEIANHAHAHPDMTELDTGKVDRELAFAQLAALSVTGEQPLYFRPPYVRKNAQLVERAAALGLLTVQYDLASGDADEALAAADIAAHVLDNVRPGSIVVLHMNNPDLPTAEALPDILAGLKERGLEPVTVSRLLEAGAVPDI